MGGLFFNDQDSQEDQNMEGIWHIYHAIYIFDWRQDLDHTKELDGLDTIFHTPT